MILLTQLPLFLFVGAQYDLIFGFNRLDAGFSVLLFLFFSVPLLDLAWLVTEIIRSVRLSRQRLGAATFLVPIVPALFLIESIAVDLCMASYARM